MVALNFSPEFAADVEAGRKTQTIRHRARLKSGDRIQLYTGQRTKKCRKLGEATCTAVMPIMLRRFGLTLGHKLMCSGEMDELARLDGFSDYRAMWEWFSQRYGTAHFTGYVIRWRLSASAETR